ncbi:MAG TPA: hypothetical protein VKE40_18075 [Gemmataceae bacterium]|nr:hypothetical protein [Gemmataceae bacterium]
MKDWLTSVRARIADGTLLPTEYYAGLDCNAALDARDGDTEFDAEWTRTLKEIEDRWVGASVERDLKSLAADIRRESFLVVSQATRQHEIASYVSDDLDLIVRGRLVGVAAPLLERLWAAYERGEFPTPPL